MLKLSGKHVYVLVIGYTKNENDICSSYAESHKLHNAHYTCVWHITNILNSA